MVEPLHLLPHNKDVFIVAVDGGGTKGHYEGYIFLQFGRWLGVLEELVGLEELPEFGFPNVFAFMEVDVLGQVDD